MERRIYIATIGTVALGGCTDVFGPSEEEQRERIDDGLRGALEADRIGAQRVHTVTVSADEDERGFSVTVRYHTPFSVDGDPADVEAATLDDTRELLAVVEDTGERFSGVTVHPTIESDGGYVTVSNVRFDGDVVDDYDWNDVAPDEIPSIAYDYEFDDGLFEA